MLRNKPRLSYCGLTIILSGPSRFDKASLLSANGGGMVNEVLRPEYNLLQCDIRVREDKSPWLEGTRAILLCGEEAAKDWTGTENTLNEVRGSLFHTNTGIPMIPSYFPQDCVDIKDYEKEFNKGLSVDDTYESDDDNDSSDEKSRHNKTKRKNFRFWFSKDCEKIKRLLKGEKPSRSFEPEYIIHPSSEHVVDVLQNTSDKKLFIDIETDYELNIRCFAFSFGRNPIFVVPVLAYDYSISYARMSNILRALAFAFQKNEVVAHNGAAFDFFVFAHKYHIPIGRKVFDTMLAMHRCFPEVEKSLGHCTSIWTWEPFHKDEGNVGYASADQAMQLYKYCGKDVFTMILIHDAILEYARRRPGLIESIQQANDSVRPYLITTLQGIKYNQDAVEEVFKENDALMYQYIRMIRLLVGDESLKKIRGKSLRPLPSSNLQCCKYFHDMLGYPIVARGKEKKDGTRGASLGKKAMLKLKLKHNNPVIDLCLAYREVAKESGSLKFTPWKEI